MADIKETYTILVADDIPANLQLLLDLFGSDFEVLVAIDGTSVLEQAQYAQPDLILLDVVMPDIDGFKVCRYLKENSSTQEIPVIFMTSLGDTVNKVKGFGLGAVDYITKPFQKDEVLARVNTHLNVRRLQQQLKAQNDSLQQEILRRKQTETALQDAYAELKNQNKSRIQAIVQTAVEGIITIDDYGTIESFNPAAERMFGYSVEEIIGQNLSIILPAIYKDLQNHYLKEIGYSPHNIMEQGRELEGIRKDGTLLPLEITVSEMMLGDKRMFTGVIRDITERKRTQAQLLYMATHDALTNLPNRSYLIKKIELALQQIPDKPFALLFLDCDRFKMVNDSLGHLVGDGLLVEISDRLKGCLQSNSLLTRFVGDKFTILMNNLTSPDEAVALAEMIVQKFAEPLKVNQQELFISLSIGIVLSNPKYTKPEDVLRDADTAMYYAKGAGKAGYQVFNSAMHIRAVSTLEFETELRQAWQAQSFIVYYQPIICLKSGHIHGFEALVRWIHPERGFISPGTFIPVAEEIGLIIPMGQWVLYEACRQLKEWQQRYSEQLCIGVNVSARQFSQLDLLKQIDHILETTQIAYHTLKLELTETALIDNASHALTILQQLKSRNIQLCIDDFGTGYSSFSYLQRLPFDILKIDRSFIMQIGSNHENLSIIDAIINLAHNLDMEIIAEGLETLNQVDYIKQLQGEYGQGYYFSRPLSSDKAEQLLAKWQPN